MSAQGMKLKFDAPDLDLPGAEMLEPTLASDSADGERKYYELKNSSIDLPEILEDQLQAIGRDVYEKTGEIMIVTSGARTPDEQARAMFNNRKYDDSARPIPHIYRNQTAARELEDVYLDGTAQRLPDREVIENMSDKIQDQVDRGVFISKHLDSNAVDISYRRLGDLSGAEFDAIVQEHGGHVLKEDDHYHLRIIPQGPQPTVDNTSGLVDHTDQKTEAELPTPGMPT